MSRRTELALLTLVLLLAAGLRLGWPELRQFDFDQAQVSWRALDFARNFNWPLTGMVSSAGVPNFPASIWLYAIPFRLSPNPLYAALLTSLLNVLAVGGLWWLARQAWGPAAATASALVFAAAPSAVFYSRDIWSQDLLQPCAVLWAIAAFQAVQHKARGWLGLHIFLAGFAFQIHYAGLALILPTAFLFLRYRWWREWQAVTLGVAWALVGAAPFLLNLLCCRTDVLAQMQSVNSGQLSVSLNGAQQLVEMSVGLNWEDLLLGSGWQWGAAEFWLLAVSVMLAGLLAGGWYAAARFLYQPTSASEAEQTLLTLMFAWLLAAPLFFLAHRTPPFPQYQLVSLPAAFLGVGALWQALAKPPARWAVLALVIIGVMAQTWAQTVAYTDFGTQARPGGLGTPLKFPNAVAQAVAIAPRIVLHAEGDDRNFLGDVAAFEVLLWENGLSVVDGRNVLLLPAAGGELIWPYAHIPALEELRLSGLSFTLQEFPRRAGDPPYVTARVSDSTVSGFTLITPVTFANGAELRGWRWREREGKWRVALLWKITALNQRGDFHVFNHLYAAGSEGQVAGQDAPASSLAWQAEDILITFVDFEPPANSGPYTLKTGMYSWPDLTRVPTLGQAETLAPVTVGQLP